MKNAKITLPNILTAHNIASITLLFALLLLFVVIAIAMADRRISPGTRRAAANTCETTVAVQSGDTLSKLLTAQGLSGTDVHEIAARLKHECQISLLRADADQLVFARTAESAPVDKIILISSPWKHIEITRGEDMGWSTKIIDIERDTYLVRKSGEIEEGDSFYVAGTRAGIPPGVLADVYNLLAFEIDFERDVRVGQEFSVLYEEYFADGEKVSNGAVIAISFDALRGNVKMYRFKTNEGRVGYYDENGNGAVKALKRTPINNARVSSSFGNRRHPILGFTRAHKGVDFRAAHGTPIPSAGAGRVIRRGFDNGYGNFVRIRHGGGFETLYAHMSKFAPGVGTGTQVRQGQIIGYVGSTGLSTGPHLHYEIIKNGVHVNPMTVKFPAIDNLNEENKQEFIVLREKIDDAKRMLGEYPNLFVKM
ncbi:MAG: peptidoglycan DD-metalloendopeptidase family protein [Alphaproteobacteria bacterium]|nr:peptidoglycan DD-metalloendopeptidase family protein [Alphaproteobacteria bacterium]